MSTVVLTVALSTELSWTQEKGAPPPCPRALRLNLRAAPAVSGALSLLQGPGTVKAPTLSLAPVCQPGRLLGTTGAPDPCTQQGHLHQSR